MRAVAQDWRAAALEPRDHALCEFEAKLTHHQRAMGPSDLDRLRAHAFDDDAIHDAVKVIGYFNYITRVADGLGVEPEDFIHPLERRVMRAGYHARVRSTRISSAT